jgi:aminoglycoside/choline kinase family phosphotransferase
VPKIFAAIPERGLVLMQDFGSTNVGALLDAGHDAKPYFLRAAEILAQMHQNFDATKITGLDLPTYSAELFTEQAELFVDAYFPLGCGREATEDEREDFRAAWMTVLRPLQNAPGSLLLRDFMPDNLMALDQNDLGVLDFQDAGMGPSGYDIASLCEEVRRDGGFALLPDVIDHYLERRGSEMASYDLLRTCTLLSAQRHTRIMGIIARMAIKADRRDKFVCLPRIKKHLLSVLCDPCLAPVRTWMQNCGALSNESY